MLKPLALAASLLVLTACSGESAAPPPAAATPATSAAASAQFAELAPRALEHSLQQQPVSATQLGDHRFDDRVDSLSAESRNARLDSAEGLLSELSRIDRSALTPAEQVDAALLEHQLRGTIWELQTLQEWAWNPMIYVDLMGSAIYGLMARDFAPIEQRLKHATRRLEALPGLMLEMRLNLDPTRVPAEHAQTALDQLDGINSLIDGFLLPQLGALDAAEQARMHAAIDRLRPLIEQQRGWMKDELLPKAAGSFRLGAERFDAKLAQSLNASLTRAQIRERAEAEVLRVRGEMYQLARGVLAHGAALPESPTPEQQQTAIAQALELAYQDRPQRDGVVQQAETALAQATEFVRSRNLITLPTRPVSIVLMPEFQRGVAVAYCDSPGPLDKELQTYYAVSPIPDDWSEAQVNSFLREYNSRSIHELSIHEAMPGHYVQIAHANDYSGSTLRAVLASGPFIEGWAVYAEQMMADNGYLNGDPLYRLIQLKWYLRAVVNAILDQAVHVDGMEREAAMRLLTQTAFQEEREAAGKWVRAQLTSTQLSTYFVGAQEHFALRAEAEQRWGERFTLREYHDRVLSYGSPPVRYVRALMFAEAVE